MFKISKRFFNVFKNRLENKFLACSISSYPSEISSTGFNNYDQVYSEFHLEKPKYFNFAKDVLEDIWAKAHEEKNKRNYAIWWIDDHGNERKWTFQGLLNESNKIANVLVDVGNVEQNDCVILILPRVPEWWFVNVACLKIGSILSPGTISLTKDDIKKRIQLSKASCVITTPDIAKQIDEIPSKEISTLKSRVVTGRNNENTSAGWIPLNNLLTQASSNFQCKQTESDDPMSWFFTSGTTGFPKMTEHTHASYGLAHQTTGRYWLDLTCDDVMWNVSDTGWAKSAYSSLFGPWWQGACVFVHDTKRFDAKQTLEILEKYPITVTCLPPTAYRLIVQEDVCQNFKALRHCVSAGEPLNPEVMEIWKRKTGLTIREGYGQTEMTLSCGTYRCVESKPGSMGKPAPGYDIQVIDDHSNIVEDMKEGDIAVNCHPVKPVGLFSRYVNDAEATLNCFRGNYYLTGDRGYKDNDGYLWFVGRSDDVIISAGYRIGPFEVESALLEHDAVAESAVVSSPCSIRGAIVKAFIVLSVDHTPSEDLVIELQNHVKKLTAPYKYPRQIEFVDSLPKTISGKIRRVELRTNEWLDK